MDTFTFTVSEFVDGLRQMAKFYEEHPDAPLPSYPAEYIFAYEKPVFLSAVKAISVGGTATKEVSGRDDMEGDFHVTRKFGPIRLVVSIPRKLICRLVRPAEYDCPDSLLEEAAEYVAK